MVAPAPACRLLLVTHAASRTGAPLVALDVLRALAPEVERHVRIRQPGPLQAAFAAAATTCALEPLHRVSRLARHWDAGRPVEARLARAQAMLAVRSARPDVVYANGSDSAAYVAAGLAAGARVVFHVHDPPSDLARTVRPHRLGPALARATVAAPSPEAAADAEAALGLPGGSVVVVPTTIDPAAVRARAGGPAEPGRADAAPVVGAVGSPRAHKGVDAWVEVAGLVHRSRPDARFVWVGGRPDAGVAARVAALGLERVVTFEPETDQPHRRMRDFAVLTMPSPAETASLVTQEAMALGLPVVAFAVPAVAALLGPTGRLVPPGDTEAMAAEVVALLGDPGARAALGRAATARADERLGPRRLQAALAEGLSLPVTRS